MNYEFSTVTKALLAQGKLKQLKTISGQLLPFAIDPKTRAITEVAKVAVGFQLNPIITSAKLLLDFGQIVQTHRGFQKTYRMIELVQQSVGVLQATTAVIGVGVVGNIVLTAVNLHNTLKLREDVRQLRVEIKNGFTDLKFLIKEQNEELKSTLKDYNEELKSWINHVSQDTKFEMHRLKLVDAYSQFLAAVKLIKLAISCENEINRNNHLANAIFTLGNALEIYDNTELLTEVCTLGKLRRLECAWAIEQVRALAFQLQNELTPASQCIEHLQERMIQDLLNIISICTSQDELDILFPEIMRICNHDLFILEFYKNQINWIRDLTTEEREILLNMDTSNFDEGNYQEIDSETIPQEQVIYEELKSKSHFLSLRD